jgi:hypothetical protein
MLNEENLIKIEFKDVKITTLKVKCNGEIYVLKMKYTDTIKDVKNYIKTQR